MKRQRSVVICAPDATTKRVWLDQEDMDSFPAEKGPPEVEFDAGRGAYCASMGFLHRCTKYEVVLYLSLDGWAEAAEAAGITALSGKEEALEIMDCAIRSAEGKRYARIRMHFHTEVDGTHDNEVHVTVPGAASRLLLLHNQVLRDRQGHPALSPGVKRLTKLIDVDTDAESEWPGFRHHEETAELDEEKD
ncbi:hypothetical protein DIPPA_04228 [Diplonema papillatum]|nr:hypothetical protein DIPPA_04228 [Diplonema papillatum]|eukprot:gene5923-9071_t